MNALATVKEYKNIGIEEAKAIVSDTAKTYRDGYIPVEKMGYDWGHLLTPEGKMPMTKACSKHFAAQHLNMNGGMHDNLFDDKDTKPEWNSVFSKRFAAWKSKRGGTMLVRGVELEEGVVKARAILTSTYAVVDHMHVLTAIHNLLKLMFPGEDTTSLIKHFTMDIESGDMKLEVAAPPSLTQPLTKIGDSHVANFLYSNNEIGHGSIQSMLRLLRLWCLNGCTTSYKGGQVRISHKGNIDGVARIMNPLRNATRLIIDNGPAFFESYAKLQDIKLSDPYNTLVNMGQVTPGLGLRLAKDIATSRLTGYVDQLGKNAYAVINAVTEEARDNEERRHDLEAVAGKLIGAAHKSWTYWDEKKRN